MTIQNGLYLVIGLCIGTLAQVVFNAWEWNRAIREAKDSDRQEVLERRRADLEANGVHVSRYRDPDDLG